MPREAQEAQEPSSGPAPAGWVIDASGAIPWFFADEATPFTEGLLDALGAQVLWAPALGVLRCTNVSQGAHRRRRIDTHRRAEIASELSALPVRLDPEIPDFVSLDRLAAAQDLSAYDAAYLELALRRSPVLVSLDARLIAAAEAPRPPGVECSVRHPKAQWVGRVPPRAHQRHATITSSGQCIR